MERECNLYGGGTHPNPRVIPPLNVIAISTKKDPTPRNEIAISNEGEKAIEISTEGRIYVTVGKKRISQLPHVVFNYGNYG